MKTVPAPKTRAPWHVVVPALLLAVIPASFAHSPPTAQEKAATALVAADLAKREAALARTPAPAETETTGTQTATERRSGAGFASTAAATGTSNAWTYTCDDVRFSVTYGAESAALRVAGRTTTLKAVESRMDAKYATEGMELWVHGSSATLEVEGERWIACRGENGAATDADRLATARSESETAG